jgi:hypothetical protein
MSCPHQPTCPDADAVDRDAARVTASFPEQGWSLLCNGVIIFDDTGELLPDGNIVAPHRGPAPHAGFVAAPAA